MKKIVALTLLVFAVACASRPPFLGGPSFKLRPYKEVSLSNGLKVLLIEEKSLPLIQMSMLIRVGAASDPEGKTGLSHFVAELLDKGTRKHTGLELTDIMAQYGAEFSAGVGEDYTMASANALSFYEEKLIENFSEIITTASFADVEIDRLRKRTLADLQRVYDDPDDVAELALGQYVYPAHPYGHAAVGSAKDVRLLKKKDITRHYLQNYRPSNAMLAVVGNFSPDVVAKLEHAFGGWVDRAVKPVEIPVFPEIKGVEMRLVDKADLQQTQIRFATKGIRRANGDFVAIRLANSILGTGFPSRLMQEIRVKRGLTYNAASFFDARKGEGPFIMTTFCRHEKVGEAVQESLRVLKEFVAKGVTEQELKEAKALLKGQFPRTLETPEALATSLLTLRYYGVPDAYLTGYFNAVDRVSLAEANMIIRKYFSAENVKILIHGPKAKVLTQIQDIAPVEVKSFKEIF